MTRFLAILLTTSILVMSTNLATGGDFRVLAQEPVSETRRYQNEAAPFTDPEESYDEGPLKWLELAADTIDQVPTTSPVLKIPGIDMEATRNNDIDDAVIRMLNILANPEKYKDQYPGIEKNKYTRLKVARITKNYFTERKQFSKETVFSKDEQETISAHHTGQAFDISEIDTYQCETKTLTGTKRTPPQPIKVAWQTPDGQRLAGDTPELDTTSFHSLTGSVSQGMINEIIADRSEFELSQLPGGFTFEDLVKAAGQSGLIDDLGFKMPPLMRNHWGTTQSLATEAGRQSLADSTGGKIAPSGFVGKDKTQLALNFASSYLEKELRFPDGSLRGKNPDEMMLNFGKRFMESQFGLASGQLNLPPSTWLPKIKAKIVQYQNGQTADLSLGLPKGTLDQIDKNPDKSLKILGATRFAELTKMAKSTAKNFVNQINRNQPIKAIPLVGVELPVAVSYNDLTALFGGDGLARGQAAEKIALDLVAREINKNPLFGNAYLKLKGQDLKDLFTGKKPPTQVLESIGANYLENTFDLPSGVINEVITQIKNKNTSPLPESAWYEDKDGNGYPDAYDDPRYTADSNGNGTPDIWETADTKQKQQGNSQLILSALGRKWLEEQNKIPRGLSDQQAINYGRDYLKDKLIKTVNLELGFSAKLADATGGLLKLTDSDLLYLLTGRQDALQTIEQKIGSAKLGEALQIPGTGIYGYINKFVSNQDLTVAGTLEKLRGLVGVAKTRGSSQPDAEETQSVQNAFLQWVADQNAKGETASPDPNDPANQTVLNQIRAEYRLKKDNKSLTDKITDRLKNVLPAKLEEFFEWDDQKRGLYGSLSPQSLIDSLKALTDKDKTNDAAGKTILKSFVSNTFDSQGLLSAGTLAELIDEPKQAPNLLLKEASKKLSLSLFGGDLRYANVLQLVYIDGSLSFNVKVDQLDLPKQAILAIIAQNTKMLKTSGEWHPDVKMFLAGETGDAFRGWAMAEMAGKINDGNPFGDKYKLTYDEIRDAYFGNTLAENNAVDQGLTVYGYGPEERQDPANQDFIKLVEDDIRQQNRLEARRDINAKAIDIVIAKETELKIQPGFAKAMLYGDDKTRLSALAGVALGDLGISSDDDLRQRLGGDFPVAKGTAQLFQDLTTGKISFDDFQAGLKNLYSDPDQLGKQFVASQILDDTKLKNLTNIDIIPGTSDIIINWAISKNPNLDALKTNLGKIYSQNFIYYEISKFADKALGLPAGTGFQIYQAYQQYQTLYATYQTQVAVAAVTPGGQGSIANAKADFKTASIALYVQVFDLISGGAITKLTSPVDKALGLPPGTMLNAALAYFSGNPYIAAAIILMGILGFGKTKCPNLQLIAQQKVNQLLSEILAIAEQETKNYGSIQESDYTFNYSLVPQQLITWGKDNQFPDWVKNLVPIADDIYNPINPATNQRSSPVPALYQNVGFFTSQLNWDTIHVGW